MYHHSHLLSPPRTQSPRPLPAPWPGRVFHSEGDPAFIPVGPESVWPRLSWLKVSVNPAPGQGAVKKPFGESLGLQIQCQPLRHSHNPVSLVLGIHQPAMTVTPSLPGGPVV